MENPPVGRQAEGDVAELEYLIEGEGKRQEGGPKQGQIEAERSHGEKEDICKEDKEVMEREDAFPAEAGEKGCAPEFLILCKGLKVHDDEVGKSKESEGNGDGKESMHVTRLENKCDRRKNICNMYGSEEFTEAAIDESQWRDGVCEDDEEGERKKEDRGKRELFRGE